MARTYKMQDASGGLSVDLVNDLTSAATGMNPLRGQMGGYSASGGPITKSLRLFVKGSNHDNAASQVQTLIKLLDKARYYNTDRWQNEPVYLKVQTDNETNPRYALVFGAREQDVPDLFNNEFTYHDYIIDYGVSIIHEHPWRSNPVGTKGSALTLAASSGSEASPTLVHVANFEDNFALNMIKVDDGGSFTTFTDTDAAIALFPATAVANDALYFKGDGPIKHVNFEIGTAANVNAKLKPQYYNGSSWADLAYGSGCTLWAEGRGAITTPNDMFDTVGQWELNHLPSSDWAPTTVDSESGYWMRVLVDSVTSWTTSPANATNTVYAQNKSYVEIPAATLVGDSSPLMLLRMWSPSGASSTVSSGNTSRIIIAAKSRGLDSFTPFLNAGGVGNDSDWVVTYGDDTSSSSDASAAGGASALIGFSTNSSLAKRVIFTGTNKLKDWEGTYKPYVRIHQIAGGAEDLKVQVKAYIGSNDVGSPVVSTETQVDQGVNDKEELITFSTLISLPFDKSYNADNLDSTDIVFEVWVEQQTGSATVRVDDLILMPVDEGIVGLDDKNQGGDTDGTSALRGGHALDEDMGVIANRTTKYVYDGTNLVPVEGWARQNRPPQLKNLGTKTRLYFLMGSYASQWGVRPLVGEIGMSLAVEMYAHFRYGVLRGNN